MPFWRHIACGLLACMLHSVAWGGFQGLTYEWVGSEGGGQAFRVYASFNSADDELVAVFGTATHPWTLSGEFIQDAAGGGLATGTIAGTGDSWLTLGVEPGEDGSALQVLGMTEALASFESGSGFTVDSDAGGMLFTYPGGIPQCTAGADGLVLIGQFVTTGTVTMQTNLQWRHPDGIMLQELGVSITFPTETGCSDPGACNYDASVLLDDGSCFYAESGLDCNGACLADADGDGVCDEDEVSGCTNVNADNFNSSATDDDGTCVVSGCSDSDAVNYNPEATADDGSCEFAGCTDSSALNYDSEATVEDGSCDYPPPGYVGLTYEVNYDYDFMLAGTNAILYRVYAQFATWDGADELVALYGNSSFPMELVSGTGFVQQEGGAAIASSVLDTSGTNAIDSYVGLGPPWLDLNSIGVDSAFVAFEEGGPLILDSDAGGMWFSLPGSGQGVPHHGYDTPLVFIGQFLVPDNGIVSWTLNLQYQSASGEMHQVVGETITFPDGAPGCTDVSACNYDESATLEDGSCDYAACIGCTSPTACNYSSEATEDDGSCVFPDVGLDCSGNCLNDADGDGICDEDEISGCMDAAASNYSDSATDEDGSCLYPGCTNPNAPNWDPGANDDDGSCLIGGCPDPDALNFDAQATVDTGCDYAPPGFLGLDWEEVGLSNGVPVYRVYALFDNVNDQLTAFFGNAVQPLSATSTSEFQHTEGGAFLATDVADTASADSWFTIGAGPLAGGSLQSIGLDSATAAFEQGGDLHINSPAGGMWFLYPAAAFDGSQGYPDATNRVLIAQLVTDGQVALNLNLQYQAPSGAMVVENPSLVFPEGELGCIDDVACNFNSSATLDDGSCEYETCAGCTDPEACNFDPNATISAGGLLTACLEVEEYAIHEAGEVAGMTTYRIYFLAPHPDDIVSAVFGDQDTPLMLETTTSFYQNSLGSATVAGQSQALIDFTDTTGTLPDSMLVTIEALEFDSYVTIGSEFSHQGTPDLIASPSQDWISSFEAGNSIIINDLVGGLWFAYNDSPLGVVPPDGRVLLAQVTTDGELSGVLNVQYAPQGLTSNSIQVSLPLDGPCDYSEAGTSCVYPAPHQNCEGECLNDADGDGLCDEFEVPGCTEPDADNFNALATDDDGSCLYFGCTNPLGVNFDPSANSDDDSCLIEGCTYPSATNYWEEATLDDGSCTFPQGTCFEDVDEDGICDDVDDCIGAVDSCGMCNGPGPIYSCGCFEQPQEDCDCNGNQLDALGVCGGDCIADTDGDGICDSQEINGCTDESACNYSMEATDEDGTCVYPDECGVCGGVGAAFECGCSNIPEGECDCNGNVLDVIGVCGGDCDFDANGNGVCDDLEPNLCGPGTYWNPIEGICVSSAECPEDITGDGYVGINDLLALLSSFASFCD